MIALQCYRGKVAHKVKLSGFSAFLPRYESLCGESPYYGWQDKQRKKVTCKKCLSRLNK